VVAAKRTSAVAGATVDSKLANAGKTSAGKTSAGKTIVRSAPNNKVRRILGLDPGTIRFGWGVIEMRSPVAVNHVAHGIIRGGDGELAGRLCRIEAGIEAILERYQPEEVVLEALFFAKDAQAAAKLGHARGVAMLVCARNTLPITEYPPARIKLAIAGHGRADKVQIARTVQVILKLGIVPQSDAADALAAAIALARRTGIAFR
jgi:crossover junction endodeoxyribonuclease RuvC